MDLYNSRFGELEKIPFHDFLHRSTKEQRQVPAWGGTVTGFGPKPSTLQCFGREVWILACRVFTSKAIRFFFLRALGLKQPKSCLLYLNPLAEKDYKDSSEIFFEGLYRYLKVPA